MNIHRQYSLLSQYIKGDKCKRMDMSVKVYKAKVYIYRMIFFVL